MSPLQIVKRLAQHFDKSPQVVPVVLAGSRGAGASDEESDFDLCEALIWAATG
jgi:hypothetical protein